MTKTNKPAHYQKNGIDVIGFAEAQFSKEEQKGFHRINAIKYITRYDRKGTPLEDLGKAKDYIDKLIEMEQEKASSLSNSITSHYSEYNINDWE